MTVELFLLGTAVMFTFIGYNWGRQRGLKANVSHTIDALINDGYLKTRGSGADLEILKWREWENEQASKTDS